MKISSDSRIDDASFAELDANNSHYVQNGAQKQFSLKEATVLGKQWTESMLIIYFMRVELLFANGNITEVIYEKNLIFLDTEEGKKRLQRAADQVIEILCCYCCS